MKRKFTYLTLLLFAASCLTTGCFDNENGDSIATEASESIEGETTTAAVIQEEKLEPALVLNLEEYEYCGELWKSKADGKYYYIKGTQLSEVSMNDFSSTFIDEDNTYEIAFKWCEIDGEIYTYTEDSLPEDFYVQTISGNTSEVLLYKAVRLGGNTGFQLCNLQDNTIEVLFDGVLNEDVIVDDINLSPDLKTAILALREPYKSVYYNGKQFINLAEVCGRVEADRVSAYFVDNKIVVLCQKFFEDNERLPVISAYSYNPEDGTVENLVEDTEAYMNTSQPGGLDIHGKYGYYYEDKVLNILDIFKKTSMSTEFRLGDISYIMAADDNCIGVVLKDGRVASINAETGKTLSMSEKTTGYSSGINVYTYEGELYAGIWADGKYLVFVV